MKKFLLIALISTLGQIAFAESQTVVVKGEKADLLIEKYDYWCEVNPAYCDIMDTTFYCKAKEPKGNKQWGYAGCSNLAWFSYGTKASYYLTMALIQALPEDLQETLILTSDEKKNKYVAGITVESLTCDSKTCEIVYDPEDQDRSDLNF
ncbi:MAG: hypothetical protein H6621_03545 [Halobacteriovoraceae bacterium]|nr:hypothetical protein [Halobacteriovoraceae bacterium]MCB9094122.1 hypothetical protein [Halobacteriovoraceae bacterium]